MRLLLIFCTLPVLLSCSKSKQATVFRVPEAYIGYVRAFESAAAERGYGTRINNLVIEDDASLPVTICAKSNIISNDPSVQKIIYMNPNITCWNDPVELETLIFHELGHCILGRQHTNGLLPNGDPASMMVENDITIYAPCVYPIDGEPCDQSFKRDYYLDELFNPATPVPDWAK